MAFFATKQGTKAVATEVKTKADEVTDEATDHATTATASQPSEGSIDEISIVETAAADQAATNATVAAPTNPPAAGDAIAEPAAIAEPMEIEPEAIEGPIAAPAFGIADAIQLMRSLPHDPNMDLVVRIVRVTLDAVNVSVQDIMDDANRKEQSLADGIAVLQGEVDGLEKQLYAKRCEIAAREAELKETASVRERLNHADKYSGQRPPPTPPDAVRTELHRVV